MPVKMSGGCIGSRHGASWGESLIEANHICAYFGTMPRFSPDFLDELRARLRASDVIGRYVKLQKKGREWCGLSPFTNEKTPSFYVNDEKARYFDFSSGKSGDIVGFLMDGQKLTFVEAVTRLAEEAGMEIPQDTPQQREREQKSKGVIEACEAAAAFFTSSLQRLDGRKAADYLELRQVPGALQAKFGLGYAPASRSALKDYLINKDFAPGLLVEAGLLIQPDDGGAPYDRFRDRLMFPILDGRGRVIAFGGRALEKNVQAKYLNSPETPVFHKGHVLYNYMQARRAAAEMPKETGQPLIVCEGYMDVIALAGAGFGNAVAPLGTALTENHIKLLWRACDEPILCFDGDRAGRQAAHRSIDRVLPELKPGKSLRFAFMPEGQDPDDFIKEKGAAAFREILDAAMPLADVLWDREKDAKPLNTPERVAAFRSHLRNLVKGIGDKDVRNAYGAYFLERLSPQQSGAPSRPAMMPSRKGGFGKKFPYQPAPTASPALKTQRTGQSNSVWTREALLVLTLVNHPELFERLEEKILDLQLADPQLSGLLQQVILIISSDPELDREGVARHISKVAACQGVMELLLNNQQLKLTRFAGARATLDEAEKGWLDTLALQLHHGRLFA
ncbi:MAG: DNA primase, partial [Aquisalinus sp.]|nr:DNA primase [Aquisalinus sp.]